MKKAILSILLIAGLAACNGGGSPTPIHDSGTVQRKHSSGGVYYLDLHNNRAGYFTEDVTKYVWDRCEKDDHWTKQDGCS